MSINQSDPSPCQMPLNPHPADKDHPALTWKGWVTAHLPGILMREDEELYWEIMTVKK